MELIPPQLYFPTDEEENWIRSAPKAKKYIKNAKATAPKQNIKDQSKKGKRAKLNPEAQKSNQQHQRDLALAEQNQSDSDDNNNNMKSKAGFSALRHRLQDRISLLQGNRNNEAKAKNTSTKRKSSSTELKKTPSKKFKNNESNRGVATKENRTNNKENKAIATSTTSGSTKKTIDTSSIEFGSLLIDGEDNKNNATNKRGVKGIKNLLKKAESNQKRMEELKKTDEGMVLVQAKGWDKAVKQAAGEKVLDDPKLLRKALKRRERAKKASAKEWKQRIATQSKQKEDAQKQKIANRSNRNRKKEKSDKTQRAGFEGKKGEKFLNKN